jgi:hypothetical protein
MRASSGPTAGAVRTRRASCATDVHVRFSAGKVFVVTVDRSRQA